MAVSPLVAGPISTSPVLPLNSDPWQGHTKSFPAWSHSTTQPAWGHMASKARKVPAWGWITRAGSPLAGSVNDAAPPSGTALAGPTAVPAGGAAEGGRARPAVGGT